jgi:protein-S-isoprenylcysteine O-methyltransferase Ste14
MAWAQTNLREIEPSLARSTANTRKGDKVLRFAGLAYGFTAVIVMWAFWVYFVIFLSNAPRLAEPWIEPSVDVGASVGSAASAALIDIFLIALFGLQHSLMARSRFKQWWARRIPSAFERSTYVHAANLALFALVLLWQPIPSTLWQVETPLLRHTFWLLFALGWLILFCGGLSFGIFELLGMRQIFSWYSGHKIDAPRLKTHWLYDWVQHPMYIGVLMGVWATPHMTVGHALLAAGLTLYVLVAMRYERRDLVRKFGPAYTRWRVHDRVR